MSGRLQDRELPAPVAQSWSLAKSERAPWEGRWQRLNELAMPFRPSFHGGPPTASSGQNRGSVYDETGQVGVDEFAARLQTGIMPAGIEWARFEFADGTPDGPEGEEAQLGLAAVQRELFLELSRSNLAAETKDSFMDLAGFGTCCMRVLPGPRTSRIRFQAIGLTDVWVTPGEDGRWADVHVRYWLPRYAVQAQFPDAKLPDLEDGRQDSQRIEVIDSWIRDLESHTFKCGTRDMRGTSVTREADYQPARVGVPMRGAESGEGRDKNYATAIRYRCRQHVRLLRGTHELQPVAQPLHNRATDEDTTFQRKLLFFTDFPRCRGKQALLGRDRLGTDIL